MKRFIIPNSTYNQSWTSYFVDNLPGTRAGITLRNWSNDFGFEHWTLAKILSMDQLTDSTPVLFRLDSAEDLTRLKAALFLAVSFEYDLDLTINDEPFLTLVDTLMYIHQEIAEEDALMLMSRNYQWEALSDS